MSENHEQPNLEQQPDRKYPYFFTTLDIENVSLNPDNSAIKIFETPDEIKQLACDILVCGGGTGGVAATLSALSLASKYSQKPLNIILTEETSWLGGQITSQGVSALDENKYIESTGGCLSYLQMRKIIRQTYRDSGFLKEEFLEDPLLHPGTSWVTRLSFEPELGLKVLEDLLATSKANHKLTVLTRHKALAAHRDTTTSSIISILMGNLDAEEVVEILPTIVIDATETGDILALANIPYYIGSDSQDLTQEPHAPRIGNRDNVQDYTYPFVLDINEGENNLITPPASFEELAKNGQFSLFGYKIFETKQDTTNPEKPRELLPFWTYRRLIDKNLFLDGAYPSDLTMINWDANDLRGFNFIDKEPEIQEKFLRKAKELSLGFVYWLQTMAPHDTDKGTGYPQFRLLTNILGSTDGLSKYPYIRESRRLKALTLIKEQDIVAATNPGARAKYLSDSIGIGLYPVDIHGYQEITGAAQESKPFQVPYSALVTADCPNYLAGAKNIGVSHITNGAYRLHPIEWAIGTAAGAAAMLSVIEKRNPLDLIQTEQLYKLQSLLALEGSPLFWFDDVTVLPQDPDFAAIQFACQLQLIAVAQDSLSFQPDAQVSTDDLEFLKAQLNDLALGKTLNLGDITGETGNNGHSAPVSQSTRRELARKIFKALNPLKELQQALSNRP
jgi:hypothetical protein